MGLGGVGADDVCAERGYLEKESAARNKKKWIFWILAVVVVLAIAGGTAAGVLVSNKKKGGSSASSAGANGDTAAGGGSIDLDAKEDAKVNGDLDKNSKEIQELMDNPNLHKVFHGIDYTPLNGVYPECNSPSHIP